MRRVRFLGIVAAASLLLSACTAGHPPEPYLPQKSGVVPGETITVGKNQNIYAIAQEHGVSMRDMIVLNGLHEPFALKQGQSLILPFKRGDTNINSGNNLSGSVEGVAAAPLGGVSSAPLGAIETQSLPPPVQAQGQQPIPLSPNQNVLGATKPSAPLEALNAPTAPPKQIATTVTPPPAPTVTAPASTAAAPAMVWPVKGPILSGYGPKGNGINNDGVNIGAPKGAPVVAAANGIVVYAGDEMKGFGNLVLIRHEGGWVTAYAHLDRALVAKDAVVAQGDMIGTVGKSGNISSPQLHFEVRHDEKPVDPSGLVK